MKHEEKLYQIYQDEGGDVHIEEVTDLTKLAEEFSQYDGGSGGRWVEPNEIGERGMTITDCYKGHILIRGRVIVPKPKTIITEYEIEG